MADAGEKSMMVAAMENEEYHRQTLRSLLKARGVAPSPGWPFYWLVGQTLGRNTFFSYPVIFADLSYEVKFPEDLAA